MSSRDLCETPRENNHAYKNIKFASSIIIWFALLVATNEWAVVSGNVGVIGREIYPSSDTFVRQYASFAVPTSIPPDPVHNEKTLRVSHADREPKNTIGLIKFDTAHLPKDEEVIYAGLILFVVDSKFDVYPRYVSIFDVIQDWDERTVWVDGAPALSEITEYSMLPFVYRERAIEFDITKLVSRWHVGKNNGLAIKYGDGKIRDRMGSTLFSSAESDFPPKLRIVMSGDLDDITPTPTARSHDEICIPYIWKDSAGF